MRSDNAVAGIRSPAFRAMWTGELVSVLGDQLAKVVVALLVYDRTGSAAASGIAYGLTFLPPLLTVHLSWLADRFPRRDVMVVCYTLQAAVVAVMAIPGMPLPALVVAAMLVAAIQTPGKAALGALVLDVVGTEANKSARAKLLWLREVGQLAGLAGAAAVVVAIGTTTALLLDAASFAVAAVLVRALVPSPDVEGSGPAAVRGVRAVLNAARSDREQRMLWALLALIGLTVAPQAVVVPYVEHLSAPTWTVGVLLGADCAGYILGSLWLARRTPDRQRRLLLPMATASLAPLAVFAVPLPWWVAAALLVVSGAGAAYLPIAGGELTERVPANSRGMVNGVANAVVRVSQGVAAIAVGLLAQVLTAGWSVAVAGLCGVAAVAGCAVSVRAPGRPIRTG